MLTNQIFRLWHSQPIERSRIFRVPSLDHFDEAAQFAVHLILGFDLRPGNSVAVVQEASSTVQYTIDGPELLSPHFWRVGFTGEEIPNELQAGNYAINFETPNFESNFIRCNSGDFIMYARSIDDNDVNSLLQIRSPEMKRDVNIFDERDILSARRPFVNSAFDQTFEFHGQAERESRTPIQLFPLLHPSCHATIELDGSLASCEAFLEACKKLKLQAQLPDQVIDNCPAVSRAYLSIASLFKKRKQSTTSTLMDRPFCKNLKEERIVKPHGQAWFSKSQGARELYWAGQAAM